jgi:hypothetical protein
VILPIPDELAAGLSSDLDVTWIGEARKPETRKRRAERVAAMLRVD